MKFTPHSTEEELIQGCVAQSRLAQKYLYQRYYGKMMGVCMRYAGNPDDAAEILNQAFMKVFTCIEQYQPTGSFGGWVARIVYNSAIDFIRKNVKYKQVMNFSIERDAPVQADGLNNLKVEDIMKLVQTLPDASRTVFCMYVIDGYKHLEIADILGISEGTSKWHLANARRELQLLLPARKKQQAI